LPPQQPAASPAIKPGLSKEQIAELVAARDRATKLRRAAGVARFDGWMVASFAVLTGLTGFSSFSTLLLAAGMGYVAWREFRGAEQFRRLDPTAAPALAINQLVLAGILIVYALWQAYQSATAPSDLSAMTGGDAQLSNMIGPIDHLIRLLTLSVYGLIVLVAIFVQGGTALYYHSRQRFVKDYIARTPAWIIELQRAGVAV